MCALGTRASNRKAAVCSESYWVQTSVTLDHLHQACNLEIFLWIIAPFFGSPTLVLARVSVIYVTIISITGGKFLHLYTGVSRHLSMTLTRRLTKSCVLLLLQPLQSWINSEMRRFEENNGLTFIRTLCRSTLINININFTPGNSLRGNHYSCLPVEG